MAGKNMHLKIIRAILTILIFFNISKTLGSITIPVGFLIGMGLLLIANDFLRGNVLKSNIRLYYFSLFFSIAVSAVLKYLVNDIGTNMYMFFYIVEIFNIEGRFREVFLAIHCVLYLVTGILYINTKNTAELLTDLGFRILIYLGIVCIVYLSKAVRSEREETKKLNEELKSSNIKLHEYSLKVEELTIARERARVAQELHDSLGHSLMALTMHLEFAEKILETKPEEVKEMIKKTKNIAKECTGSLRAAVSALKEERDISDLREVINELSAKFSIPGNLKVCLNMDDDLEDLNPDIKLCIYKTIREGMTNSIKHGKATAFDIDLNMKKGTLNLSIHDNGVGCGEINESNGLKGIGDRIRALGGIIKFESCRGEGFTIKANIPL